MEGYTALNTFRYERKFIAARFTRAGAEATVRQNSAFFIPVFKPRRVNNIYFDTPGMDCYFANLFGIGQRWKVRIRWYGDLFGEISSPILEFKIKNGFAGTKKSFHLPPFTFMKNNPEGFMWSSFFDLAGLPPENLNKLHGLQPVLLNTYFRSYFSTLNKKFRITVDDQMKYYHLRSTWNNYQHVFKEETKTVIELKYDKEWDSEAEKITNQFPFRLNKNSKFVTGINHFRSEIAI